MIKESIKSEKGGVYLEDMPGKRRRAGRVWHAQHSAIEIGEISTEKASAAKF
jgi:hypothetical protein